MRYPRLTCLALASTACLLSLPDAIAGSTSELVSADEIERSLKGKICTTRTGATFSFSDDGHYVYDGLWRNGGHYMIKAGGVLVAFDSGLQRMFSISLRDGALYIEKTAMSCTAVGTVQVGLGR